jgi:hypothetical protein
MQTVTIINEDSQIQAIRMENSWQVLLGDGHSGKTHMTMMNDGQFGAVLALAIGGDEDGEMGNTPMLIQHLYNIAETALFDCPKECRPIP